MLTFRVARWTAAVVFGLTLVQADHARLSNGALTLALPDVQAAGPEQAAAQAPAPARRPDVIYVPTTPEVVAAMLKLAKVTKNDIVYDMGCGDGRIPVTAARDFGARGVGIDIDPERIKEAKANVAQAGVGNKVKILQQDLFTTDIKEATVVTLYLLQSLNQKLRPKLISELKPGTRIVSHAFDMGEDWKPEVTEEVGGTRIYLWTVPKK